MFLDKIKSYFDSLRFKGLKESLLVGSEIFYFAFAVITILYFVVMTFWIIINLIVVPFVDSLSIMNFIYIYMNSLFYVFVSYIIIWIVGKFILKL